MSIRRQLSAILVLIAGVIGLTAAVPMTAAAQVDIADRLRAVPGLTIVSEEAPPAPGFRFFFLTYRQPSDHLNPQGGTFEQRFSLLHRDTNRPMVLHTTGYDMPEFAFRSEPTRLIDGNQISTEQRFFSPSRPNPADWTTLTIWQAATDHHRLILALKPIYNQKWISTGASKGGMTSVYHRRFYPRDIDGVAAYVAPNDVVNRSDDAYDRFFDIVGNDPACRTALANFQREAFLRRTDLVNMYEAYAAANGLTFNQVFGTADAAFEFAVLDSRWAFWQFLGQNFCGTVPPVTASTQEIFDFVDATAGWGFYADQGILFYSPYFYQAATQLGWPQLKFRHVRDLFRYPGLYNEANSSLPAELRSQHDAWPMTDIDRWVTRESSQMLFVYGANDPWGAEPFRPSGRDSYTYNAPGSNHGANISRLTATDAAAATATLQRWAGVSTTAAATTRTPSTTTLIPSLDTRTPDTIRRPL
ncbi:MAG TPA: S28 family serine protease [Actinophytocola sp.]|uniref:S28 family serine protease n=1 Tax=Actinophytocola sp. TaxID=1872138 RepID=UPI002DBAE231|nr:S28 family serine protease [Actinophytocola sp.]HEU5473795.1 S28 family serine protease [Actinophytocola sp.]